MDNNEMENRPNGDGENRFSSYWIYGLLILLVLGLNFYYVSSTKEDPIDQNVLEKMVMQGDVAKVVIGDKSAEIFLKDSVVKANAAYKIDPKKYPKSRPHFITTYLSS